MALPTGSSRGATLLVAAACTSLVRIAGADATPADQALAQSLFDEGRKLMAEGDFVHACPKFVESERLDPGGGTVLNLALCHEGEGKTASAWTEFNEAVSRGIRDGRPERVAKARERIAALEPVLSRLTVSVTGAVPPDLQVTVDGTVWAPATRGVAVPLDPGEHVVAASASGGRPWSTTIVLGRTGDAKTVVVPDLQGAPPSAPPTGNDMPASPPAESSAGSGSALRTTGLVVGGVGVAGVGVGAVFGLLAMSQWNQQKSDCATSTNCASHSAALADHSSLVTDGAVSTVGFVAGGVLLAGGALLYLVAPASTSPSSAGVIWVPSAGPRDVSLGVRGSF
jgi:hypothetical protein